MTMFADASLHERSGAAGWGAWAIRDDWNRGRFHGGPLTLKEGRVCSSNVAELGGIAMALWTFARHGELDGVTSLMVQCDNVSALAFLTQRLPNCHPVAANKTHIGKTSSKNPNVILMLVTIERITKGIQVSVKHVKGHQGSADGRSWVNEQCDTIAKKHMRALSRRL